MFSMYNVPEKCLTIRAVLKIYLDIFLIEQTICIGIPNLMTLFSYRKLLTECIGIRGVYT